MERSLGKKLTIYMIDGTSYGPRLGEIGNWVGKAIYSPRSAINKILNRAELESPGVYCLKGDPINEAFEEKIYIGEAENIKNRLKQHLSNPDRDFKELLFFVSKDEWLTKTQIKYLESRLIQLAIEAKSAEVDNGNVPSLPTLHEADISDMEYFLEQIKLILPVMGFKFLNESTVKKEPQVVKKSSPKIYYIKNTNLQARMIETDKGYIVLKGSEARKDLTNSCTETYQNLRKKLIETNILIRKNNDKLVFAEDAIFNSVSAASNMVLGRNSNGFTEWIDKNNKTFKEIQEKINEVK